MYNFYQSDIRRKIQEIYGNEVFEIRLRGKTFRGIVKKKSIFGFKFERLQVLGIILDDNETKIKDAIRHIKQYCKSRQGVIFFQLGIINTLTIIKDKNLKEKTKLTIWKTRLQMMQWLKKLGLHHTVRENMSPATIICNIQQTEDEIFSQMSSQAKRYVRKAKKRGVLCEELDLSNKDFLSVFWEERGKVSKIKGFHTITKNQFENLVDYFQKNKTGKLRVAKIEGEIVAGGVYLYDKQKKQVIYLYGFSKRDGIAKNLGAHYFLKRNVRLDAKELGFKGFDLLGGSPTGDEKHPLVSVSKFKESLGGNKIEYYGSFDLIINYFLYYIFKILKKLKKIF